MALMLAPYNEAMRLGMGSLTQETVGRFNSYTQQLCCNDIVRLPGGRPATESDLKDTKQDPPSKSSLPGSGAESSILSIQKGTESIVQKKIGVGNDNQNVVSQVVDWHASFVDTVSEVTKKLDISGALSVNVDAIGSVKVAGHYVDDKALKESDATYDITVNVTNQRLEAPQLTHFAPIANIDQSRFQEVYGDCFISGFQEGGVFHATVACKRVDDKALLDAGGEISAGAKISGLDIKGEIKANFKTGTTKQNYTTTITVNWSGGGDIKPDSITEWDIKNLTRVAMDFPDKVAACPQRTYAILTKYTSLRSFHEATLRGSPLDYENAGIYTNSLLDSYMDYKYIWSQIQERIAAVDKGLMTVKKAEEQDGLSSYRESFAQSYQKRLEAFQEAQKSVLANPGQYRDIVLEPPMPSNALQPYTGDLYGLDHAKRDCRFEMIKIVREVKAVSLDPQIAVDATRIWQYVAPSIFRRLVPSDKPIDKKNLAYKAAIEKDLAGSVEDAAKEYHNESTSRVSFYQSGQPICDLEKRVNLRYGHLAKNWRVDSVNGQSATSSSAKQFNDFFNIDAGRRNTPERVSLLWLEAHADEAGKAWVDTIRIATSGDLFIVEPIERFKYNNSFDLKATKPKSGGDWELKGFYGSFDESEKAFAQLSPIWGRTAIDDPAPKAMPLFDSAAWRSVLSWPISTIDSLSNHLDRGDNYRLSYPRGSLANTTGTPFNALDHIDENWVLEKADFYFENLKDMSVLVGLSADYTIGKQLQYGKCSSSMPVQTWRPADNEKDRLVAISSCIKERTGQSQCSLGVRLFFEREEEEEKPKQEAKEEQSTVTKPTSEPASSKPAANIDVSKPATESTVPPKSAPPRQKVIKKTELWFTGPLGHREDSMWSLDVASLNPSRDEPSESWIVKGFMGQAGIECIETVAVVWGKE
ncbi:hypothetical protein FSARC_14799 [Fusarium sarcochroum]|uniref:MACPF domain-containing protein n=1 Tax=Fusarium sarcochroum TaxID=1208366 RepID=A0A8H4SQP8_9HYPO|nr:hypothetical protein FSARC_14799 [Fusarium sarcochroum]